MLLTTQSPPFKKGDTSLFYLIFSKKSTFLTNFIILIRFFEKDAVCGNAVRGGFLKRMRFVGARFVGVAFFKKHPHKRKGHFGWWSQNGSGSD